MRIYHIDDDDDDGSLEIMKFDRAVDLLVEAYTE